MIPEGPDFRAQHHLDAQAQLEADLSALVERYAPPLGFRSYDEFAAVEERSADPVIGTSTETILPADGLLLMYGDGGAGKTTLSIDAAAHLGAGSSWLGLDIPKPMRVAIIENEGPRGKFRQMLSEKKESWQGAPFSPQITVMEEPWTQFTLQVPEHREGLAHHISEHEIDVVVMGPLVTLGMVGGGTPDEVSKFEALVGQTRALCSRVFALWVIHHENKAGDVSGAWERVPDTLCHVQAQGNGHTRIVWRKARWSSENHGKAIDLTWAEGRAYELVEQMEVDHHAELIAAFTEDNEWRTVKESAAFVGHKERMVKEALADLVERGEFEFQKGPPGRVPQARCYRLRSAPEGRAQLGAVLPLEGSETRTAPLRHPYKEKGGSSAVVEDPTSAPTNGGAVLRNPLLDD